MSTLSRFHRVNLWLKHYFVVVPMSLAAQLSVAALMVRYRVWKTPERTLIARARSAEALAVGAPRVAVAGGRRFR